MPKNKGKTEARSVRQNLSLDLRVAGASYRQIAERTNVSEKTAYYDVQDAVSALDSIVSKKAERLREIELIRLDKMTAILSKSINRGEEKSCNTMIRVMERRAKLLGLDAAIQVKQELASMDGKPFVFTMQFDSDANDK